MIEPNQLACRRWSRARTLARLAAPRRIQSQQQTTTSAPEGFTLLEIILALAILAGSLAALGEVMRLADQNAGMTRDESQAQILAASIMDELVAGARETVAVDHQRFDYDVDSLWVYSITIQSTSYEELVAVQVRVEQDLEARLQPAHYELIRWLTNPNYVPPQTDSSSTTSSTGGSTGTGGTGSQTGGGTQL